MGSTALILNGKPVIHSHTALQQYTNCAHAYYHERVLKDVKFVETEAIRLGNAVHKALENFIKYGTELPLQASNWKAIAEYLRDIPGDKHTELKMAVTHDGEVCGYFDHNAYLRGNADLLIVRDKLCIAIDYKTGSSRYANSSQAERYAFLVFAHFPEVERIESRFIYGKDKTISKDTFVRSDIAHLRKATDATVADIVWSAENDSWPKSESPLCNYCASKLQGRCDGGEKFKKRKRVYE